MTAPSEMQINLIGDLMVNHCAKTLSVKIDSRSRFTFHEDDKANELVRAINDDPHNMLFVTFTYDDFRLWFSCKAGTVLIRPNRLVVHLDSLTFESDKSAWRHTYTQPTTLIIDLDKPVNPTFDADLLRSLYAVGLTID